MAREKNQAGFTLVEMAMVLTIIGLIVGGVLFARDMIRQAELRKDTTIIESLNTSVNVFVTKYNCLPGDCLNMSSYFSGLTGSDGDGTIYASNLQYYSTELALAMAHLAKAGLIGLPFFTYTSNTAAITIGTGVTALASAPNQGVIFGYASPALASVTAQPYILDKGHFFRLGVLPTGTSGLNTNTPPYTPTDAFYIDSKLDDGMPYLGKVVSAYNTTWNNANGAWAASSILSGALGGDDECVSNGGGSVYDVTNTWNNTDQETCGLRIRAGF